MSSHRKTYKTTYHWKCLTCSQEGTADTPRAARHGGDLVKCPTCGSEQDENHGPHDVKITSRRLIIRNITGIAEERGFRLYWETKEEPNILVPALGYATSNPFRTAREARAYAATHLKERAVLVND